jgi:hypothetical protein
MTSISISRLEPHGCPDGNELGYDSVGLERRLQFPLSTPLLCGSHRACAIMIMPR